MSTQINDKDIAVTIVQGDIRKKHTHLGDVYFEGHAITQWGIVLVLSEPGDRPYTLLRFVWMGRLHSRDIRKFYQRSYLVTLAKRFADEVVKNAL